ncbi:hypothetical protein DICSQDRAFT_128707 [Dichomitus squalens LYAD-421 SS1]|uniref:Uncharacterized protein n=1 Tax=Dichomitus squalens (strain LYAD-421) TaxID=732165 RepID=R7SRL5_DICSQ|nr:uncharacterized protein DICSQDRAFT_128707 [Dichomitus squalens LYAD-421 SS1]EJF58681.1 hypothetical protein DICSQDRAFT_128707 [Dichomitus squalens LYAD-421 SS1]
MSSNATSTVPTSLPSVPSLDNTFGAVLIGTFLGLIVYTADASLMKFMIMCLALLDAGNAVVTMHACYYYLVTNYHNPSALPYGVCTPYTTIKVLSVLMVNVAPPTLPSSADPITFSGRNVGPVYRYVAVVAAMCTFGAVGMHQTIVAVAILLTSLCKALGQVCGSLLARHSLSDLTVYNAAISVQSFKYAKFSEFKNYTH